MKLIKIGLIFVFFCVASVTATASALYPFSDPAKEQQFQTLITELRCLVCQNQNLADSDAPLAEDLRKTIYEFVQQGLSTADIQHFLTARYGEFILYRPKVQNRTIVLWFGPFILLILTLFLVMRKLQEHKA